MPVVHCTDEGLDELPNAVPFRCKAPCSLHVSAATERARDVAQPRRSGYGPWPPDRLAAKTSHAARLSATR